MRIEIVEARESWPREFAAIGAALRAALGDVALAIHHIGSTAVPGLAAKDVVDVQVTVAALGDRVVSRLVAAGYRHHAALTADHRPAGADVAPGQLDKHVFTERGGERRANVHVRAAGAFNQRYALLFREHLRASRAARDAYGELKRQLAWRVAGDRDGYCAVKDPAIDMLMAGAEAWARATDWELPPSDA